MTATARKNLGDEALAVCLRLAPMRPLDPTLFPDVFRKPPEPLSRAR